MTVSLQGTSASDNIAIQKKKNCKSIERQKQRFKVLETSRTIEMHTTTSHFIFNTNTQIKEHLFTKRKLKKNIYNIA